MAGEIDVFLAFGETSDGSQTIQGETSDFVERQEKGGLGRSLQIRSYSLGFSLNTTNTEETHSQSGEIVTPELEAKEVTVQKYVDAATPALLKAMERATRFKHAVIKQRKAGVLAERSGGYFWELDMLDVMVSALQWSTEETGLINETITLTYYEGMKVGYQRQTASGTLKDSVVTHAEIQLKTALKTKDGKASKDGKSNGAGADLTESQIQTVTKRVLQAIKTKNPNLNIRI